MPTAQIASLCQNDGGIASYDATDVAFTLVCTNGKTCKGSAGNQAICQMPKNPAPLPGLPDEAALKAFCQKQQGKHWDDATHACVFDVQAAHYPGDDCKMADGCPGSLDSYLTCQKIDPKCAGKAPPSSGATALVVLGLLGVGLAAFFALRSPSANATTRPLPAHPRRAASSPPRVARGHARAA